MMSLTFFQQKEAKAVSQPNYVIKAFSTSLMTTFSRTGDDHSRNFKLALIILIGELSITATYLSFSVLIKLSVKLFQPLRGKTFSPTVVAILTSRTPKSLNTNRVFSKVTFEQFYAKNVLLV